MACWNGASDSSFPVDSLDASSSMIIQKGLQAVQETTQPLTHYPYLPYDYSTPAFMGYQQQDDSPVISPFSELFSMNEFNRPTNASPSHHDFLPMDPTLYPMMMPEQYLTQAPCPQQQLSAPSTPVALVSQADSENIAPQSKEKKPRIKKPLNAFMLFIKEKRADVIKEHSIKESTVVNQILGRMWRQLDSEEKKRYFEMAHEEKLKHQQMYPGWSLHDSYGASKKRKKRMSKQKADDNNNKKCRVRFGKKLKHLWCEPCWNWKKKKCMKADLDSEDEATPGAEGGIGAEQSGLQDAATLQTKDSNIEQC